MATHQLNSDEEVESMDCTVMWNRSRKEIGLIDGPGSFHGDYTQGHGYSTFSHLMMNSYAAGYYAYLQWVILHIGDI